MTVEPEKSHDIPSVSWRIRQNSDMTQSKSKDLRTMMGVGLPVLRTHEGSRVTSTETHEGIGGTSTENP